MMGSRDEILGRLRRALAKPSLEHHHGHQPEIADIAGVLAINNDSIPFLLGQRLKFRKKLVFAEITTV